MRTLTGLRLPIEEGDVAEAEEVVTTRRLRQDGISQNHRTKDLDISPRIHRARLSDANDKDEAIQMYPDEANGF